MHDGRAASPTNPARWQAVVFDLDGTLVDSRAAVVDAVAAGLEEVLRRHGIEDVHPDRRAIVAAMGLPADAYYRAIVPARLQHLAGEVQAASTRHEVQALERGAGCLFAGVDQLLNDLRQAGLRLAVISNAQAPYFAAALRWLRLAPRIDHGECHGDLPPDVPGGKRVLLARALAALGVPAARTWMVGDRRDDVDAGRAEGCRTMGAAWGIGHAHELEAADVTADRPLDLVALLGLGGAGGQAVGDPP